MVVPGSVHHTGAYCSVVDDADPEVLPQWVVDRVGLWVPHVSGHQPSSVELARWGGVLEWSTPDTRARGVVVYQRCVRWLETSYAGLGRVGRRVPPAGLSVGEWVARGAYCSMRRAAPWWSCLGRWTMGVAARRVRGT